MHVPPSRPPILPPPHPLALPVPIQIGSRTGATTPPAPSLLRNGRVAAQAVAAYTKGTASLSDTDLDLGEMGSWALHLRLPLGVILFGKGEGGLMMEGGGAAVARAAMRCAVY